MLNGVESGSRHAAGFPPARPVERTVTPVAKELQPLPWWLALGTAFALLGALEARAEIDYGACAAPARSDPDKAYEEALAWQESGGGEAARHCAALALFGLARFADAAQALEALAQDMTEAPPTVRAEVLAQAGQARLAAGQPERAEALLTAAHSLYPASVEILVDRGQARMLQYRDWEAIDDFNLALEREPDHVDALIFRATLYRRLEAPELAADDLERALEADPSNVFALLERGVLRGLARDIEGARADWTRVIESAPESPAADSARGYLNELESEAAQPAS